MFLLITFSFIAVVFLIGAGLLSLLIRLTGRKGNTKAILKWSAVTYVLVAPLVVFVVLPLLLARQVVGFGTRGFDLDLEDTPESYGCPFEEVSFRSRDGLPLAGWWMPGQEDRPIFVITHGLFRDRKEVTERGCQLNRQGFGVLAFDLRRHGASGGGKISLGYQERLDVLGAYDFIRADSSVGVILMGVSMGATACILALPDAGPDLAGLVADSPFLSLRETVDHHVSLLLGLPSFPFSNVFRWELTRLGGFDGSQLDDRVGFQTSRPVPCLLIYGEEDLRMPRETAEAVFESIPHWDKAMHFFSGAGHGAAWRTDSERYLQLVLDFVNLRVLKKTTAR